jgi:hypothetical protein
MASDEPVVVGGSKKSKGGEPQVIAGRGLDVGTANLVAGIQDVDGNVIIRSQRNAFIDIKSDEFTKKMLTKLNVQYVTHQGRMYVLGDAAFELANVFGRETRRPMKDGMISPGEVDALPMIKLLISQVIGEPVQQNELCYFCVPADPIDKDMNVVYHRDICGGILKRLGYGPKFIYEGHAIVFSELAEDDFTGIGISCGGGMFNIAVSYKTVPCLAFSTTRAGDWIDANSAAVIGAKSTKMTAVKEKGVNLANPTTREEEALAIYYRNVINYTLTNIKERFGTGNDMPSFTEPVDIVCAGGTSLAHGFIEVFKDEFQRLDFPIEVKNIRLAADPLNAIAQGLLIAAQNELST